MDDVKNLNDIEFDGLETFADYIIFKMAEFGFKTSAQNYKKKMHNWNWM